MRLAILGDLHYHMADENIAEWVSACDGFYKSLLQRFIETDADYHISLGDLTNYGSTEELQAVYKLLEARQSSFYHVLGNHDLYEQSCKSVLALTGQPRYHAIDTELALLVFLDTNRELSPEDWSGWIDDEQLQWFEDKLVSSGIKPLLVFAHHPVYGTTARSESDRMYIDPDIDMWRILDQKQGPAVYFNGHNHMDSIVIRNNWHFVQLSAGLDDPSLRIVDVSKEAIRITAIDVTEATIADHARILHQHIRHFSHKPDGRGQDADRNTVISLLR